MRLRFLSLCLCALAALVFVAGCERADVASFTAEIDEPNYRRGKDLLRQGRNQEALASFLKVVDKRGDDAPESHLEIGILYQQHIKDPIAAIYHYRKFRELKPNSPQADLVRQRIDAATRDFARTLPAQPLENQMEHLDLLDKVDQLQRENSQLKEQLIAAKTQAINTPRPSVSMIAPEPASADAGSPDDSPIARAPDADPAGPLAPAPVPVAPPARPQPTAPTVSLNRPSVATPPPAAPRPAAPVVSANARRHTIAKGDTLFSLAQRYYGNRSRWRDIYAANRDQLSSENTPLRIGMELKIP
ncbi:MAG: LysM peptidoglycan-binding domain-containing protein [Verrucomicrobia bacterium]|nr:LysM peptidoglycan-binding domain-containing protein [Verrucomicrobiota bacterium]